MSLPQVNGCEHVANPTLAEAQAAKALNEQSAKVAAVQKSEEAQAEGSDPQLKAAATMYRTAEQELLSAQQDLESRKLMARRPVKSNSHWCPRAKMAMLMLNAWVKRHKSLSNLQRQRCKLQRPK